MGKPNLDITLKGKTVAGILGRNDLIIGTVLSTLSGAGKLTQNLQDKTAAELTTLFGSNTHIRGCIDKWMLTNKKYSRLDVLAHSIDDVYCDPSVGKVTFTGTAATAAGSFDVSVVSDKDFKATIPIVVGDTPTTIGDKLVAAVGVAYFPKFPCTASNSTGDVSFTTVDLGLIGLTYSIKVKGYAAGISVAVTAFADGTGVPHTYATLSGNTRYAGVLLTEDLKAAKLSTYLTFFEARFNVTNKIMDGVLFASLNDTLANINTTLADYTTYKCMVFAGNKPYVALSDDVFLENEYRTGNIICHPTDWTLAEFMGCRSIRLETGAPVSDIVTASGLDNVGGIAHASLPYFNTPLAYTPAENPDLLFSEDSKVILEGYGYTVIDTNSAGSAAIMGSVPTTYSLDSLGNADTTFGYLEFVDTGSVCREYIFNAGKIDLAQQRLTNGDLQEGRNIQNAGSIESLIMKYVAYLIDKSLVQGGSEIVAAIAKTVVVTLTLSTRTAAVQMDLPIVTQFGTMTMTINLVFDV